MNRKNMAYVLFIIGCVGVGALSSFLAGDISESYALLEKPPLSPPGVVFPIVWTVLFILMGISAAMVWLTKARNMSDGLTLFFLQLAVNFLWPIIFFGVKAYAMALIWLILLVILVALMIKAFYPLSQKAAYLQIPYMLWLVFALYLNAMAVLLNP